MEPEANSGKRCYQNMRIDCVAWRVTMGLRNTKLRSAAALTVILQNIEETIA